MFYELEGTEEYSPIDEENKEYILLSYEEFFNAHTYKSYSDDIRYRNGDFISNINGEYLLYKAENEYFMDDKFTIKKITGNRADEILDIFPIGEKEVYWCFKESEVIKYMIPVTLREIYDVMQPLTRQLYLKNGRKFNKEIRL